MAVVPLYQKLLDCFRAEPECTASQLPHPRSRLLSGKHVTGFRRAAVLIPVTRLRQQHSHVVLTVRSANLGSHAGQISLPGGTQEPSDQDATATALRETQEEIGLRPEQVEVIGWLGEVVVPSGFRITPVVGIIDHEPQFRPCPTEVADVFQVPLDLVLNPAAYRQAGYPDFAPNRVVLEFHYRNYRIWGATAAILHHLAVRVAETRN